MIGNKKDLEDRRQVTYEEGEALAKENGLMFLEASAKTAYNVVESFNLSAQSILNSIEKDGFDPNVNSNIKINNNIFICLYYNRYIINEFNDIYSSFFTNKKLY